MGLPWRILVRTSSELECALEGVPGEYRREDARRQSGRGSELVHTTLRDAVVRGCDDVGRCARLCDSYLGALRRPIGNAQMQISAESILAITDLLESLPNTVVGMCWSSQQQSRHTAPITGFAAPKTLAA